MKDSQIHHDGDNDRISGMMKRPQIILVFQVHTIVKLFGVVVIHQGCFVYNSAP